MPWENGSSPGSIGGLLGYALTDRHSSQLGLLRTWITKDTEQRHSMLLSGSEELGEGCTFCKEPCCSPSKPGIKEQEAPQVKGTLAN